MDQTVERDRAHRTPGSNGAAGVRSCLLEGSIGLVEDVRGSELSPAESITGFSPSFQVALPYRGMFVWHVGRDEVVGDPNQVLYVTGGESYSMSQPLGGAYAELIVTPEQSVLSELTWRTGTTLTSHPLFRRRTRRITPRVQAYRTWLLHWAATSNQVDRLAGDEAVLTLLRSALSDDTPSMVPSGPSTARLIRRAKAFLEAELANPIRLADVGRAVGASPAYLTHVFRRVEGASLHRYLTQLRLSRALVELPYANDLTTLALEVGFSSHSHFTAAFRQAFGCTPSTFRMSIRRGQAPPLPSIGSLTAMLRERAGERAGMEAAEALD
jgi:AraC-like DNA-binding protein